MNQKYQKGKKKHFSLNEMQDNFFSPFFFLLIHQD